MDIIKVRVGKKIVEGYLKNAGKMSANAMVIICEDPKFEEYSLSYSEKEFKAVKDLYTTHKPYSKRSKTAVSGFDLIFPIGKLEELIYPGILGAIVDFYRHDLRLVDDYERTWYGPEFYGRYNTTGKFPDLSKDKNYSAFRRAVVGAKILGNLISKYLPEYNKQVSQVISDDLTEYIKQQSK